MTRATHREPGSALISGSDRASTRNLGPLGPGGFNCPKTGSMSYWRRQRAHPAFRDTLRSICSANEASFGKRPRRSVRSFGSPFILGRGKARVGIGKFHLCASSNSRAVKKETILASAPKRGRCWNRM